MLATAKLILKRAWEKRLALAAEPPARQAACGTIALARISHQPPADSPHLPGSAEFLGLGDLDVFQYDFAHQDPTTQHLQRPATSQLEVGKKCGLAQRRKFVTELLQWGFVSFLPWPFVSEAERKKALSLATEKINSETPFLIKATEHSISRNERNS